MQKISDERAKELDAFCAEADIFNRDPSMTTLIRATKALLADRKQWLAEMAECKEENRQAEMRLGFCRTAIANSSEQMQKMSMELSELRGDYGSLYAAAYAVLDRVGRIVALGGGMEEFLADGSCRELNALVRPPAAAEQ